MSRRFLKGLLAGLPMVLRLLDHWPGHSGSAVFVEVLGADQAPRCPEHLGAKRRSEVSRSVCARGGLAALGPARPWRRSLFDYGQDPLTAATWVRSLPVLAQV